MVEVAVVRFLRWRGKKNTDRGLTFLEITLAVVFLAILVASFWTARRNKGRAAKAHDCTERQWRWASVLEDMEWKLRRWEMSAGACLKEKILPIERQASGGDWILWDVESSRPMVRDMEVPHYLPVPATHQFKPGPETFICSPDGAIKGKIREVLQGGGDRPTVIHMDYDDTVARGFGKGTLVVAVHPLVYEIRSSEQKNEKIVYQRRSEIDRIPQAQGFEDFVIQPSWNEMDPSVRIRMEFSKGDCRTETEFSMYGSEPGTAPGDWFLRKGGLVFEPWSALAGATQP